MRERGLETFLKMILQTMLVLAGLLSLTQTERPQSVCGLKDRRPTLYISNKQGMFKNQRLIFNRGKISAPFAPGRASMLIYTIVVFAGFAAIVIIIAMTVLNGESHIVMTVLMLKLMCSKEQVNFVIYPEMSLSSGSVKTDLLV